MRKLFITAISIIMLLILFVFVLRFIIGGDEDTWLCQNGQWVQHGHPNAPMPTRECK